VYSRDGSVIMFAFHDKHRGNLYGVGVVRADGSDMRWLSDSTVSSEEPKWSDDGEWVLFEQVPKVEPRQGETPREELQRRQRMKQYFAIHSDGTGLKRMPSDTQVNDGSVSRDGRWSVRSKSGPDGGIFITERAIKQERQLVSRTSVPR
jgi:Tol biopolymer transport system component